MESVYKVREDLTIHSNVCCLLLLSILNKDHMSILACMLGPFLLRICLGMKEILQSPQRRQYKVMMRMGEMVLLRKEPPNGYLTPTDYP